MRKKKTANMAGSELWEHMVGEGRSSMRLSVRLEREMDTRSHESVPALCPPQTLSTYTHTRTMLDEPPYWNLHSPPRPCVL